MIEFLLALAIAVSLAAAAFCAGAETCFLSVSRERILHLSREGGRKARIVQAALSDMGRTTTALLVGNNLASVVYSSASAALAVRCCSGSVARLVWSLAAAFLVLYVSEFLPKLLCSARPLRRVLALAGAFRVFSFALAPLTSAVMCVTGLFIPSGDGKYRLTAADLVRILQDRKDGVCLSDIESALVSRLVVCRVKNRPVTADTLLDALDAAPSTGNMV